ncbi:MAG: hypothetical protein R6V85_16370 [Polyangia bacterium]
MSMSPVIDDEKLVAYLLGELEGSELEEVGAALESDSKLRAALDELKSTAEIASRALEAAEQQSLSLTSRQRDEVRAAAAGPEPKASREDSNPFSLANLQSLDVENETEKEAEEARWRAGDESSGLVDIRSMKLEDEESEKSGLSDLVEIETHREGAGLAEPVLTTRSRLRKMIWPLVAGAALVIAGVGVLIAVLVIEPGGDGSAESDSHREMIAALQREIEELKKGGGGGSQEMADLERRLAEERAAASEEAEEGAAEKSGGRKPGKTARRAAAKKKGAAGGAKKSASAKASSGSSSRPKKSSGSASSELDDLLGGSAAPARKKKKAAAGGGGGSSGKLSRSQVQAGMRKVAGAVRRCGQGDGGRVLMKVVISPTGRVKSAKALGAHAGTPVGRCAERAVFRARFDRSESALTVKYPFALD